MQISTMSMVVACIVEVVRLGEVGRMNLYTSTDPVPMSVFWLTPQYFIIGAAEIMVNIGTMELFYSEVRVLSAATEQSVAVHLTLSCSLCLCALGL